MLFPFDRKERSKPRAKPEPEHYVGGRASSIMSAIPHNAKARAGALKNTP